jgi:hypothetical protein
MRIKGMGFEFIQLAGAQNIRKVLNTSYLDSEKVNGPLGPRMFRMPEKVCQAHIDDNSGTGAKPHPESNIPPAQRVIRARSLYFADLFSRSSMDEFIGRFIQNLEEWCENSSTVSSEWVEMPDLFNFIRDVLFNCAVTAFYGKTMLELNPNLQSDFWEYDNHLRFLAAGFPNWMNPAARSSRDRCFDAMKKWRDNATKAAENLSVSENDSWDPAWGLAATRRRNEYYDNSDGLYTEEARVASDLGFFWA